MKKVLLSMTVVASLFANGYEIGGGIGYSDIEKSNQLSNKKDLNLRIGKYLPKNHILRLELEKSISGSGSDLTKTLLNVEHYFGSNKIQPYGFAGLGYQFANSNYSNSFVADLGIGAKYNINEKWSGFVEARALRAFDNNDNHYSAILGVNYKFGFKSKDSDNDGIPDNLDKCSNTPAGVAVDVNGCPIDSDNDGVADYLDKCPNTPSGVAVDVNGCPIDSDNDGIADYLDKCPNTPSGVAVDVNGCPIDSDNDGVADYLDKCPNTPAGVAVDVNGCPIDSDNDGVADYLDKCPNTQPNTKVNRDGCPLNFNFKITFSNNSSILSTDAKQKVAKFAKFLETDLTAKAIIEGYTDNIGSKAYNTKLSEKRAKAVYDELLNDGISGDRLSYKGFGPVNPIASNDTEQGRLENRRVIAKIIYKVKN